MSSKAFSDTIRQVRKARIQLSELEDQLFDHLEDKYELKEELQDLVREIIDNVDMFDDAATVENMLTSCCKKAPARGHRRNAGKKTKEEVIQTVKERRSGTAGDTPAASEEEAT